jgi:hypothetical protein
MPYAADRGNMDREGLIAALCNLAGLALVFHLPSDIFFGGFGITQFARLGPLWHYRKRKGKTEDVRGVAVIVGITLLLSAACWAGGKFRYDQ